MKSSVDIHVYLATTEDMEDWYDDPEAAADVLNEILHITYDKSDDEIESHTLVERLERVWEIWHRHPDLTVIDVEDLCNWVDHELIN